MAKLPMYQRRVTPQAPEATAQQFGSGVAAAQGDMGNVLQQIGDNMRRRNEVIDRVRLLTDFDQTAMMDMEALQAGEDFTDPAALDKYKQSLRERAEMVIANHNGRSGSKAELRAQIDNQVGQYTKAAMSEQIRAQKGVLANYADMLGNELAIKVTDAPEFAKTAFDEYNKKVEQMFPALNEAEQRAYIQSGRQKIASAAINGSLQRGDYETAKALLKDPAVGKYLSPDAAQSAAFNVAAGEGKVKAEQERVNRNVMFYGRIMEGLTPEQEVIVRMFEDDKNASLSQKIVQLELLQDGRPASLEQRQQLAGALIKETTGSGGTQPERDEAFLLSHVDAIMAGTASEQVWRQFTSVANRAYGDRDVTDKHTGMTSSVRTSAPTWVNRALNIGTDIYGSGMTSPPADTQLRIGADRPPVTQQAPIRVQGAGQPQQPTPPERKMINLDNHQQFNQAFETASPDVQEAAEGFYNLREQVRAGAERTLWDRAKNLEGLGAKILPKVKKGLETVGVDTAISGEFAVDQQFVTLVTNFIANSLRENQRSSTELEELKKELGLLGDFTGGENSYKRRLLGTYEAVQTRIKNEVNAMQDYSRSPTDVQNSVQKVAILQGVIDILGVPPMVRSEQEMMQYPSGTELMTEHMDEKGERKLVIVP